MTSTFAPQPARETSAAPASLPDDERLVLPDAWTPAPRAPVPLVASAVPILGAVVLWMVTGSLFSLLFAALGPLIAVASVLDGRRGARRDRRHAETRAERERARVAETLDIRHDRERRRSRLAHPDVVTYLTRDGDIWRSLPERGDAIAVGLGEVASEARVIGGEGDPESSALRVRASRLTAAPITIPVAAGIAVTGDGVMAAAVHRALVLQHCLAVAPGEMRIVGSLSSDLAWVEGLPHRHASSGRTCAVAWRLGDPVAETMIVTIPTGAALPPGCGVLLSVTSPDEATLDDSRSTRDVRVEGVGLDQASLIAAELSERAARTRGIAPAAEAPIAFASIIDDAPPAHHGGLPAVIGVSGAASSIVDLVADGPHAVVAGVTGSGKSELLITWILALAATHSTRAVTFLLADFKGGTAFDGLRDLPHVTGVITDLDGAGARRAIESLRAEVRWRESELARQGARDILDPRVELPRLVVVVDEFAALLGDHPELGAVFGDVAARGRALGLHLILGTQRVAGIIRDSLLANCPLRVSLRVTDAVDSRAVVGTDDAAHFSGTSSGRGIAFVRRGGDTMPQRVRVALSTPEDIHAVVSDEDGPAPRRPWLPALPDRIELAELRTIAPAGEPGMMLLGLVDEPERQRQRPATVGIGDRGLLVVGGPGSGKTTALETLAGQASALVRVPATGEGCWDATMALSEAPPAPGTVIVVDDLDTVTARLSADHAHVVIERLEQVFRGAGEAGVLVVASAQRLTGAALRLGELLPRRLVLGMATKADHLAVGGDPAGFVVDSRSGRGHLDRVMIQVAMPSDPRRGGEPRPADREWMPAAALTGLVTRRRAAVQGAIEAWEARGIRVIGLAEYVADPSVTAEGSTVVLGDPDDWQREWRLLASMRGDHDFVVDTTCAGEYRVLTGLRELPPYADPGARRAWLHAAGGDAVRIVLPRGGTRASRRQRSGWS